MKTLHQLGLVLLLALGLAACGDSQKPAASLDPVAFHDSDECHVCGMVISDFPGPKGEAVSAAGAKKFCSAAEMIGWWLQPENRGREMKLYVHDMGRSVWETPNDEHLIDATSAYYVIGTPLKGAMGAVLASFADEQAAQQLAAKHGGRVLRFEEIDQALLQEAAGMQYGAAQGGTMHEQAAHTAHAAAHNEHAGH